MFQCNETKNRPSGKDTLPALCRRLHSRDIGSRDNSAPEAREGGQARLWVSRDFQELERRRREGGWGPRFSAGSLLGPSGRARSSWAWPCAGPSWTMAVLPLRLRCLHAGSVSLEQSHPRMRRDELLHREPRRCRDSQGHARPHLWVLPEPSQRGTQGKGVQWTPWLLCSVVSCHHPLLLVFLLPSGWQGGFRSHGTRSRFLTWAPCAQSRRSRPLAVLCVPYRLSGKDPHPRHTHATTYTRAHVCTVHTRTLCPQALTTADSTWPATFSRINSWLFFGN